MSGAARVAYVVRSWPRLSQTFVVNEVLALERLGVGVTVFAMTRADERVVQPQVAELRAGVHYLDASPGVAAAAHLRLATRRPRRYLATLAFALTGRRLLGGYTRSGGLGAFHRAALVAARLGDRSAGRAPTHVHAHFAHDPALIGLLVRRLCGLPFTFTAHARDLYQIPEPALRGRAREARAVVTCCRVNADHIRGVVGEDGPPVELIHHGVDLATFRPAAVRAEHAVPEVVSVGRLVEKKGFDDLLRAVALLRDRGVRLHCEIHGDGPCRAELEALRDRLGLAGVVDLPGARTQAELLGVYQRADVFALTPRVMDDGDRDGIPNVLVEAMACGVPVVSTRSGGVEELVTAGADGLLAPAGDVDAIAARLEELLVDPGLRRRLGDAAAASAGNFDGGVAARRLAALFGHELDAA
ncbi:MAG TPA: glycosyltransferase [Candidatus Dormibacteraeota bacterium]